ncbi:uncharacterized protein LOC113286195 [Papaver somniferum]|uniref:uncharacterized protein LOC113286195 n=1 Tax=Papaver somniferum TaxID=3469 RepID=UPI000E6F957E|nr:uncharacterized protein LOC113286195 [Papaver somniferum]
MFTFSFLCSCKHTMNNRRISCCRWDFMAQAILPYCQALEKFAPHIQQFSMETKGKGVSIDGVPLHFEAGEIDFGEPDSNGQHSFYQLIHQYCKTMAHHSSWCTHNPMVADMSSKCDYLQGWLLSNKKLYLFEHVGNEC